MRVVRGLILFIGGKIKKLENQGINFNRAIVEDINNFSLLNDSIHKISIPEQIIIQFKTVF